MVRELFEKVQNNAAQPTFVAPGFIDRREAGWSAVVPVRHWGWIANGAAIYAVSREEEEYGNVFIASCYLGWNKMPNHLSPGAEARVQVQAPSSEEGVHNEEELKNIARELFRQVEGGKSRPGHVYPGHWDKNIDLRTGYESSYPAAFWLDEGEGALFVITHEAAGTCPSGPCGSVSRITLVSTGLHPTKINWTAPLAQANL